MARSPQVNNYDGTNEQHYSDLQVLRSNAGWYIGTVYTDPTDGFKEPGSRDSDYFPTREAAQLELDKINRGESTTTRLHS
jgi:hypothetical protein